MLRCATGWRAGSGAASSASFTARPLNPASPRDVLEVPAWLDGGPEPSTITDGRFRPERLHTLRTRLSAAYKGIHALLMAKGAIDFRSGQPFGQAVFCDEYVDIHHIFPKNWCNNPRRKIEPRVFDTVINKTPLSYKTNRILGGVAPSVYLARLEAGGEDAPPIASAAVAAPWPEFAGQPDRHRPAIAISGVGLG